MNGSRKPSSERGAVLVLTALLMVALVLVVAIVIDLGATRSDRRNGQLAVDTAAMSAAQTLLDGTGESACQAAIAYLELSLETELSGQDCAGFSACPTGSFPVTASGPGVEVTLHRPVADNSPLLAATSTIGFDANLASDLPGTPCDRIGIKLTSTGKSYFGGIAGQQERRTVVHSVAVIAPPQDPDRIIQLAVLHRSDCGVITTSGNEGSGIVAKAYIDPVLGRQKGLVSVDSTAKTNCDSNNDAAIDLGGANSTVRADGPYDCPAQLPSPAPRGAGCGQIDMFALRGKPSGCTKPACDAGQGSVAPSPEGIDEILTRAPVDYKYNCLDSYGGTVYADQPIDPCPFSSTRPAYISLLKSKVGSTGTPTGFQSFQGAGFQCQNTGGGPNPAPIDVPIGNWVVDCGDLRLSRPMRFLGGNIIFDGNITINGSGALQLNTANTRTYPWTEGGSWAVTNSTSADAFFYLRNGTINRGGTGVLEFNNMLGFFSETSSATFSGGTSLFRWTAPTNGPFKDLALWSDSARDLTFGGGSGLRLDGAFFVPRGLVTYSGGGANDVTAQFVVGKVKAQGGGTLQLTPTRGIKFPPRSDRIELVR